MVIGKQFEELVRIIRRVPLGGIIVACTSLVVTTGVVGVRHLGGFQALEILTYDRLVQLSPDRGIDDRFLLVEITEADIATAGSYPLSDRYLAKVFASLQKHRPRVIGLDLARDVPIESGREELLAQFQKPNVVVGSILGNKESEKVKAPPGVPLERTGFLDGTLDPDGAVRRNLMLSGTGEEAKVSLGLRTALMYLEKAGIQPQWTATGNYQIGKVQFSKLVPDFGGYQLDRHGVDYAPIQPDDFQILLEYRSPRPITRRVSITEVLEGRVDPKWIEDKLVLIGPTAPTIQDFVYTPYAGDFREIPGVMVHAQMSSQVLSAVLDQRGLFRSWSEPVEDLWIFVWVLIGAGVTWRMRHPITIAISSLLLVGLQLGLSYALFTSQVWVPIAAPISALGISLIITRTARVAQQIQESWQRERMVMRLLGQQTSAEIADALWQSRDNLLDSGMLPWQTLTATMLFTDIKNFSTVAEKIPSSVLMPWLNEYLSILTEAVLEEKGIVNKFTGDGIMAVFGVPIPRTSEEDINLDAQRAVAAALGMRERLKQMNQEWQKADRPPIQMRVGIFTGLVTVGSLGGKYRLEYGVIGDSVNIASRLESCEKERQEDNCRILIGEETLIHLQEKFEVESWGSLFLKGRQTPVEVYRVKDYARNSTGS